MNLTNPRSDIYPLEQSTSFSKYFSIEDRLDDYNYSESNINETLLLEVTHLDQKHDQTDQKGSLLKDLREDEGLLSREKSLVFQLCGDYESSNEVQSGCREEKSRDQIEDLYNICRALVDTLSKLENKVEKIEEKQIKIKDNTKSDWNNSFLEKEAQSVLTYSSLKSSKGSKGCKCQSQINQKDVISGLLEALQSRSNSQNYKKQNEQLKKQIIRLEIANEEVKKVAKKAEAENSRLRELLRQYQNFNKRLIVERQFEQAGQLSRNHSQRMLSQRQMYNSKSNMSSFEKKQQKKMFPFQYYHFEEQKENLKGYDHHSSKKIDQRPKSKIQYKGQHMKCMMNYHIKEEKKQQIQQNESKTVMEPLSSRKKHQELERNKNILSFEQFRPMETSNQSIRSSPYILRGTNSKMGPDNLSRTFRELKQVRSRLSKRDEY